MNGLDKQIEETIQDIQNGLHKIIDAVKNGQDYAEADWETATDIAFDHLKEQIAQAVQEALAKQRNEIANEYGLANMDKFEVRDFNQSITYKGEEIFNILDGFNEVEDGDWYTIITYKPKVIKDSTKEKTK